MIRIRQSQYLAVGATSGAFASEMIASRLYRFTANSDCWVRIGGVADSAAANTANNHLYIKGQTIYFSRTAGDDGYVHVIRDAADGAATLSLIEGI
jgi:hypothetical protein